MNFLKKKNKIIFISIILYLFIYFLLIINVLPKISTIISTIFILFLAISSFILYNFKRFELTDNNKKAIKLVFISIFIYFTLIYFLGLFTGYGKEVYSTSLLNIIKNIFLPLIGILSLEALRYNFISNNKDNKKVIYFITFLIILLDISLNFYLFKLDLTNLFIFITVTVLPLIFKNSLLSYIDYKVGYFPCILYTVTLCLFKYLVPYKPILGNYLSSVVNIAFPALTYIYLSRMISNELYDKNKVIKNILKVTFIDIPLLLLFTIGIGLISGFFKYHLIGVEKSSISKIKKGDAILINKKIQYKSYDEGDIIAYSSNNKIIIDKVTKTKMDSHGNTKIFITKEIIKGKENKYKLVDEDFVLGKYVNFKISKIAKPTIWFKHFIKGDLK